MTKLEYELAKPLVKRYKEIIEKHCPIFIEEHIWWIADTIESGIDREMDVRTLDMRLGHVVGQLVAKGWADLYEERKLLKEYIALCKEGK